MGRKVNDLTGKNFGDLQVISRAGSDAKGAALWHCICHRCGKEIDMQGYRLTASAHPRKDCGCRWREKIVDLSGQTIGNLDVLRMDEAPSASGDRMYWCRCRICGKIKKFPACTIRAGVKSCGCQNYNAARMKRASADGVAANIVGGTNLNTVFREGANGTSETGVRGVCPEKRNGRRTGTYRAYCTVCGEMWVQCGFATIESAKEARDKAQAELIEKHGVKRRPPR